MNGSSSNHTLSPKQAQSLINDINEKGIRFIRNIESSTNQFLDGVSKIWADDNAVSVAKEVANSATAIVDLYGEKSSKLKDEIVDICRRYSQAGGFGTGSINNPGIDKTININSNIVKDTFDGDRYGFDDNSSVRGVYDSLSGLKKQLNVLGGQLSSDLQKTNAFGNSDVKVLLARCANGIVSGLDSEIDKFINFANGKLNEAKTQYVKVTSGFGGNNSSVAISVPSETKSSSESDVYVTDGLASARETVNDTYFTKPDSKTSLIDAANGFVENQVDGFKDVNTLIQTTAEDPGLVADAFKYAVKNTLFGSSEYKAVPNNKPKITIDGYKAIRNK